MRATTLVAMAVTASVPAQAAEHFFRARPMTMEATRAEPFSFAASVPSTPGEVVTSDAATLVGYRGKAVTIVGADATYQLCSAADCSGAGPWTATPGTVVTSPAYVRVRVPAGAFGSEATAVLTVGAETATFTARARAKDADPDPINWFNGSSTAPENADLISNIQRLRGHDGITVSVTGTTAEFRLCANADCSDKGVGGWGTAAAEAVRDSYVQLRMNTGAAGTTRTATLAYGGRTVGWTLTSQRLYAPSEMGIADASLLSALTGTLGTQKNWKLCATSSGAATSDCAGLEQALVVHRSSITGTTYGFYASYGAWYGSRDIWDWVSGFYFTNASGRAGYRLNGAAQAITTNGELAGIQYMRGYLSVPSSTPAFQNMLDTSPYSQERNGAWTTTWRLSGRSVHTDTTTFNAYGR